MGTEEVWAKAAGPLQPAVTLPSTQACQALPILPHQLLNPPPPSTTPRCHRVPPAPPGHQDGIFSTYLCLPSTHLPLITPFPSGIPDLTPNTHWIPASAPLRPTFLLLRSSLCPSLAKAPACPGPTLGPQQELPSPPAPFPHVCPAGLRTNTGPGSGCLAMSPSEEWSSVRPCDRPQYHPHRGHRQGSGHPVTGLQTLTVYRSKVRALWPRGSTGSGPSGVSEHLDPAADAEAGVSGHHPFTGEAK